MDSIMKRKNAKTVTVDDLIKLADKIKGNISTEWLNRYNKFLSPKSH